MGVIDNIISQVKNIDPHINPQSGVWDDNWYSQHYGNNNSSGGSSTPSAADTQKQLVDAYNKQNDAYVKGLSDYEKSNPFNFDDMLKQESQKATANISPVYTQLLNNYLKGIENLKGNTVQDQMRAATLLQADRDAFQGQARNVLETTLRQVGQDYGNANGYDSGARGRSQGIQEANTAYDIANNERQYQYNQSQNDIMANRVLNQAIPLESTKQEQAYANQERSDIYNQSQQLANYDQAKYNYNKQLYATSQVPDVTVNGLTTKGNTIPGLSAAQTTNTIQGLLPGVQVSGYGGATPSPIMGYGTQ